VNTAKSAGCKSILVLCGKEKLSNRKNWEAQPDFIFKNLYQAAGFILKNKIIK
jgi:phosphoglycolate phosphatase-like HAD superfamily hydrolase